MGFISGWCPPGANVYLLLIDPGKSPLLISDTCDVNDLTSEPHRVHLLIIPDMWRHAEQNSVQVVEGAELQHWALTGY